ncbi:MAG: beta-lactamase family protein [Robiginitomaculum sp.]|nr:beta-lactamase family protein [Robiginitomaculum sp.]
MKNDLPLSGAIAPGFDAVRDEFVSLFTEEIERGGAVAVYLDGQLVVDLVAGWADRACETAFSTNHIVPVFSCSKAISSLVIASLVEQEVLSYSQKVSDIWPEFAAQGKADITVGQVLSHQAGLVGIEAPWQAEDWFDWDKTCERLAAMKPMWALGDGSGYHPISWGYLAGEIVLRATNGRSIGTILREDFCQPNNIDFMIGLPDAEHGRVAQTSKPTRIPSGFANANEFQQLAFLKPWSSPGRKGGAAWRRMEIPSANGHGTAKAMAQLISLFAGDGTLGGKQIIGEKTRTDAMLERVCGQDRVLPHELGFGAGLICNSKTRHVYGPGDNTVGHTGFGGSVLFADPDKRLSFGYVTTKQDSELVKDVRAARLTKAVYECLL